jgi:hypothetical protein
VLRDWQADEEASTSGSCIIRVALSVHHVTSFPRLILDLTFCTNLCRDPHPDEKGGSL